MKDERRPRGRPRNTISKRPVTTYLAEDVYMWLKETQHHTGIPFNVILHIIIRNYIVKHGNAVPLQHIEGEEQ